MLAIGLMSGTSLDGVDAVLIKSDGENRLELIETHYLEYGDNTREQLQNCARDDIPLSDILRLEQHLTQLHANAVNQLLAKTEVNSQEVSVIGFHGQTIRHLPDEGLTWQLGNPSLLAEQTKIPVVSDFRRRDMAAGGQGAPLVPLFHKMLFSEMEKPLMIVNIGGVANFTWIGAGTEDINQSNLLASDCGPGMGLIDLETQKHFNEKYDVDGKYSQNGEINQQLIEEIVKEEAFFQRDFPKSADRYEFDYIKTLIQDEQAEDISSEDTLATLCGLTTTAIIDAGNRMPERPQNLWVCGGGAKHPLIMKLLKEEFDNVKNVDEAEISADFLEAECFAWLAIRRLKKLDFTLPQTTACQHTSCGGTLTT